MKVIENKTINYDYYEDEKKLTLFENIQFENCKLRLSLLGADEPNNRSTIRNISLNNCTIEQLHYAREIFEEITITNLKTRGVIGTNASVFKHVTLKGKIGEIILHNFLPFDLDEQIIEAYIEANKKYYETVDWALDISEAEFVECCIYGIPSHLIKRDPETQVIIKKENAIGGEWNKLKFKSKITMINLNDSIDYDDFLIIAPKRAPFFKDMMEDIKMLRKEGFVE